MSQVSQAFSETVNKSPITEDDINVWCLKCQNEYGADVKLIEGMSWKEMYQLLKSAPEMRPNKRIASEQHNINSNNRLVIKEEDINQVVSITGLSKEEAHSMLIQTNGDVQAVLNFLFG